MSARQADFDRWPAADCCGAAGCSATTGLQRVEVDGRGTLVLCSECAREARP